MRLSIALFLVVIVSKAVAETPPEVPQGLLPFWLEQEAIFAPPDMNGLEYLSGKCVQGSRYCVVHWAEVTPSTWDMFVTVIESGTTERFAELQFNDKTWVIGYIIEGQDIVVTTRETVFETVSGDRSDSVSIYQLKGNQFLHLSETPLCSIEDASQCKIPSKAY